MVSATAWRSYPRSGVYPPTGTKISQDRLENILNNRRLTSELSCLSVFTNLAGQKTFPTLAVLPTRKCQNNRKTKWNQDGNLQESSRNKSGSQLPQISDVAGQNKDLGNVQRYSRAVTKKSPHKATSWERPNSSAYLRLKNSKRTSKCQVFSSTVPALGFFLYPHSNFFEILVEIFFGPR